MVCSNSSFYNLFREKSLLDTDKTIENESGIEEIEIEEEKVKKTEDFMKKNQKKIVLSNDDKMSEGTSSNSSNSSSESEDLQTSEKSEDPESKPEDKTIKEINQTEEVESDLQGTTVSSGVEDKVEDMKEDELLEHS